MGKESKDRDRREKDRKKDRDREKDRERDKKKNRKRSRSRERHRSRSPREKRKRERKETKAQSESSSNDDDYTMDDILAMKTTDQSALLQKMALHRKEKIEQERAKKAIGKREEREKEWQEKQAAKEEIKKKAWTLDDEDEELLEDVQTLDQNNAIQAVTAALGTDNIKPINGKQAVEDDEDPLDAFMAGISKQASKKAAPLVPAPAKGKGKVVTLKAVETDTKKGEIMETDDNLDMVVEDVDIQKVASLTTKGRLLAQTDHEKIYYRPFRKAFYTETSDIARMSKADVEAYREELDGIKVRGKKVPKPIKTWAQCGVDSKTLQVLKRFSYEKPTPIQTQAIPAILSGRDVIGIAKTGSGKTLAFLLPMFRHVLDQDPLADMDGPIAIIMAPTRELAMQTWKEANKFAKVLDLRVVCVYGGVGISEQIADLKRGAEIIVCTPGRMMEMLAANSGKVTNLRRTTYLVLDEADRMFDMGFEPQVMKIIENIRPDRQTVLFSATFPRQMEALAKKSLRDAVEIQVGGRSVVCSDVVQNAVVLEEHQKLLKLLELLGIYYEQGSVVIFVDKQEKADTLLNELISSGYSSCASLHGGIDQFDRDSTITDFKNGTIKIMVATSVAARGLDVKGLILVVNYDCPNHYEDYVHRVGRTGRAGNRGYAYTFVLVEGQERMAGEVCRAFESAGATPPEDLKTMFEKFKEEMAAQGKEVHLGGKGFTGSGFKYDEAEAEAVASKKTMAKLVAGMEAGDDDDDDTYQEMEKLCKSKRRLVNGNMPTLRIDEGPPANPAAVESKKEAAAKIAARIAAEKIVANPEKDSATKTAEAILRGDGQQVGLSSKNKAQKIAEQLNSRLNHIADESMALIGTSEETEYFEEELEINDFPQQVRYKICSRDNLRHINEYADVGISVKGTYYPEKKQPKPGDDRKLYLFLEARTELNLRKAKEEIFRIMKEAMRNLAVQTQRQPVGGRYNVF